MRTNYKVYLFFCILAAVLTGGCTGNSQKETAGNNTEQEAEDISASASAAFEARTLDGDTVSENLFSESRITMVNVWATYCNPCLSEMPGLGELADAYDPQDFQIVGIISDVMEDADQETLQYAGDLVEQTDADYPHLLLNESLYNALLTEVSAVPTSFFIDQNGQILDTVIGAMEKASWEEKINAFLEK